MIDFTENKNSNIALCGIYMLKSLIHLGLAIRDAAMWVYERIVKRYPMAVIAVVILASLVVSIVQIGKARAERDNISHELYIANEKIESLEAAK